MKKLSGVAAGAVLAAVLIGGGANASAQSRAAATCRAVPRGILIDAGRGVRISVRTVGAGRPLLLIPSFGRGSADFDEVAGRLSARGFMVILPEPRGINGSNGPAPTDLFDLADDVAGVAKTLCRGPIDVVGHAFGNRVARAFATAHRGMVGRVGLLAGGGEVPLTPLIAAALKGSMAQGGKPDDERIKDLQLSFFARGSDPTRWLTGWYAGAATWQGAALRATPTARWWTAGGAPILLVQAAEDPIAPAGNADALRRDIGDKLTLVTLRHASHAILPEQPAAVAAALATYFGATVPEGAQVQKAIDAATNGDRAP